MNSRSELKELLESGLDEEEAIQALEMSMKCNHEDVGSSISDKHQQTNDHSSDDSKNQSNYDAAHSSNQASRHKPHPLTQEENMNILKPPHDMDPETQIKELTDAGLTKLEAFMALHMSMKHNDANTLETDMDLDFVEAVNCLQNAAAIGWGHRERYGYDRNQINQFETEKHHPQYRLTPKNHIYNTYTIVTKEDRYR
eukprot:783458_1